MAFSFVALLSVLASCSSNEASDDVTTTSTSGPSATETSANSGTTGRSEPAADGDADSGADPDAGLAEPTDFEGRVRLLNLYTEADGTTMNVDMWAKRSFTNKSVLLAENVEPGSWSEYVEAPVGQSIVVVRHGDGPDGDELSGIFSPRQGEQITGLLIWESGDMFGAAEPGAYIGSMWERSAEERPDVQPPPEADKSLLTIYALPLLSHQESFTEVYGGTSFHVGDGSGACLPQQRTVAAGFTPAILGGTNMTVHELDPGTAVVTLHKWPGDEECAGEAVLGPFEVDLQPGAMVMLVLWSPDGESIEPLVVPID